MSFSHSNSPRGNDTLDSNENNIPLLDRVSSSNTAADDDPVPRVIQRKPLPTSPAALTLSHRPSTAHAAAESNASIQLLLSEDNTTHAVTESVQNQSQRTCLHDVLADLPISDEPRLHQGICSEQHRASEWRGSLVPLHLGLALSDRLACHFTGTARCSDLPPCVFSQTSWSK